MNNGHTRESKHRIAVLEDEDVETFVAFCEYAYTGDYTSASAAGPVRSRTEPLQTPEGNLSFEFSLIGRSPTGSIAARPVIEGDGAGEEVKQAATTEHELLAEEDTTKNEPAEPLEDEANVSTQSGPEC
ncbi:hypothetical protein N7523_010032 [Penicillium sp. IBT 18751x]|nr:hypothetical protein N7523_010032 [Penicillium sp. IBT 18751x]